MFSDFIRFASENIRRELPQNLPLLLHGGTPVKHNPVRDVFKKDGFFIKIDHRKFHTFAHEFSIALALQKAGLPVVEHLAYGRIGNDNFLISRELAGAVSAEDFLDSDLCKADFIESFTVLMQKWQKAKFSHADPHFGNLLYVPEKNLPVLVDVHDIKRRVFFGSQNKDIIRFIFNLRGRIPYSIIFNLLAKFQVRNPQLIFERMLSDEIIRIKAQWRKRCRQLFNAYPKFSVQIKEELIAAKYRENFTSFPEEPSPDAAKIFAASFFLSLLQIPHRRCIAVNIKNSTLRFENELSGTPNAAECAILQSILTKCGFDFTAGSLREYHGLAAINDISAAADSPFFKYER